MTAGEFESGRTVRPLSASHDADPVRRLVEWLPRPLRFLGVGALGLITDLSAFTAIIATFNAPLVVRLISLAVATLVTWRLNRALTFGRSGRRQGAEAMRYAMVTAAAQGISYAVFAALVLSVLHWLPQAALIAGAAVAAAFSYFGHRLFAFAPSRGASGNGALDPSSPFAARERQR